MLGWSKPVDSQMFVWIPGGYRSFCGVADGPSHAHHRKVWFTRLPVTRVFVTAGWGGSQYLVKSKCSPGVTLDALSTPPSLACWYPCCTSEYCGQLVKWRLTRTAIRPITLIRRGLPKCTLQVETVCLHKQTLEPSCRGCRAIRLSAACAMKNYLGTNPAVEILPGGRRHYGS